jgi:hypothetical protein
MLETTRYVRWWPQCSWRRVSLRLAFQPHIRNLSSSTDCTRIYSRFHGLGYICTASCASRRTISRVIMRLTALSVIYVGKMRCYLRISERTLRISVWRESRLQLRLRYNRTQRTRIRRKRLRCDGIRSRVCFVFSRRTRVDTFRCMRITTWRRTAYISQRMVRLEPCRLAV